MSDRINLSRRVESLDIAPQFTNYSKVRIWIGQDDNGDDIVYEAGDDYGRTLEIENPFGTQAMANRMLQKLRGYQYQPYRANGALLDPAAEIGDVVSVRNIYGGIYNRSRDFSHLMKADIGAPHDEEIDHEYKYETPQERKYHRQFGEVRATLTIQANAIEAEVAERQADSTEFRSQLSIQATEISAKVSQRGGNNSSFGWSLLSNEFGMYAGSRKVFYVNSSGAHVQGEITATSGKIGGFTIGSNAIYNNISTFGGTQTTGVYLGTNGIQLGQRFKVDSSGNVTASNINASNMKLTGTLTVGDSTITANNLRMGAERANSGYSTWNGTSNRVSGSGSNWDSASSWTSGNGDYCVGGAGWGYNFGSMDSAYNSYPINASSFRYQGTQYTPHELAFYDGNQIYRSIWYLGPASE